MAIDQGSPPSKAPNKKPNAEDRRSEFVRRGVHEGGSHGGGPKWNQRHPKQNRREDKAACGGAGTVREGQGTQGRRTRYNKRGVDGCLWQRHVPCRLMDVDVWVLLRAGTGWRAQYQGVWCWAAHRPKCFGVDRTTLRQQPERKQKNTQPFFP